MSSVKRRRSRIAAAEPDVKSDADRDLASLEAEYEDRYASHCAGVSRWTYLQGELEPLVGKFFAAMVAEYSRLTQSEMEEVHNLFSQSFAQLGWVDVYFGWREEDIRITELVLTMLKLYIRKHGSSALDELKTHRLTTVDTPYRLEKLSRSSTRQRRVKPRDDQSDGSTAQTKTKTKTLRASTKFWAIRRDAEKDATACTVFMCPLRVGVFHRAVQHFSVELDHYRNEYAKVKTIRGQFGQYTERIQAAFGFLNVFIHDHHADHNEKLAKRVLATLKAWADELPTVNAVRIDRDYDLVLSPHVGTTIDRGPILGTITINCLHPTTTMEQLNTYLVQHHADIMLAIQKRMKSEMESDAMADRLRDAFSRCNFHIGGPLLPEQFNTGDTLLKFADAINQRLSWNTPATPFFPGIDIYIQKEAERPVSLGYRDAFIIKANLDPESFDPDLFAQRVTAIAPNHDIRHQPQNQTPSKANSETPQTATELLLPSFPNPLADA